MTKRSKSGAWLVGWVVLVYIALYIPIVAMGVNSFNASRYSQTWGGFTFKWYVEMVQDEDILSALWTSLWTSLVATLISVILGTLAAVGMRGETRRQDAGEKSQGLSSKSVLESLLMVPVILPEIVMGISMLLLFVFLRVSLGPQTIILAHVTFCMVYVFLVVRVRLKGLDPALEEAAQDLGATPVKTFFSVTFPLIVPGVVGGALLAFTLSFEDFLVTFFTAGVGTTTLPIRIYSMTKFGVSPVISALSTAFLFLIVIVTVTTSRWKVEK